MIILQGYFKDHVCFTTVPILRQLSPASLDSVFCSSPFVLAFGIIGGIANDIADALIILLWLSPFIIACAVSFCKRFLTATFLPGFLYAILAIGSCLSSTSPFIRQLSQTAKPGFVPSLLTCSPVRPVTAFLVYVNLYRKHHVSFHLLSLSDSVQYMQRDSGPAMLCIVGLEKHSSCYPLPSRCQTELSRRESYA